MSSTKADSGGTINGASSPTSLARTVECNEDGDVGVVLEDLDDVDDGRGGAKARQLSMGGHDKSSAAEAATVPFVILWRMMMVTCDRRAKIIYEVIYVDGASYVSLFSSKQTVPSTIDFTHEEYIAVVVFFCFSLMRYY